MTGFELSLPALRGVQAERQYFVIVCPLELVPRLFQFDDERLRPELRAQRVVNPRRVPEIARYLTNHPKSYVLSSLTGAIDGAVRFKPLSKSSPFGFLKIAMTARLIIHDGLHRREAIERAIQVKPELAKETVSVVLFLDPGLKRAEQVFSDLKRNETHSARSQGLLYDHRDEIARLTKGVIKAIPVFAELTEMVRSKISNRSFKLFTFSGIYHANKILLAGRKDELFSTKLDLATQFWRKVTELTPDWERARSRTISPAALRKNYVHAHAIALAALARVGASLLASQPDTWFDKLDGLETLDWSRSNTSVWEGRAMIAGRLSKATTCVVLTGNAIKRHLRVALTAEEKAAETRLRGRTE